MGNEGFVITASDIEWKQYHQFITILKSSGGQIARRNKSKKNSGAAAKPRAPRKTSSKQKYPKDYDLGSDSDLAVPILKPKSKSSHGHTESDEDQIGRAHV